MDADETKANKALVVDILRAYSQGDLRPLMAVLDEAVTWKNHARSPQYRFGGSRNGPAGVMEAAAMIAMELSVQSYTVKELVAEGGIVWALSDAVYLHNESNKLLKFLSVTRWALRRGKVVGFDGFFDTASVLAQQGRLAAE